MTAAEEPDHRDRLHAAGLDLSYLETRVVEGLHLSIPNGKITSLIGANGCGKSTTLKAFARLLKPAGGAVYLDGKAIHEQPTKAVAQQLALLPQGPEAPAGLTVRELVSYGRFPHQKGFGSMSEEDHEIVDRAMSLTETSELGARPVGELSGGQRQRAWIAMALAQDSPILLLDEPTTFLDIAHQLEVLQLLQRLNRDEGRTILLVIHELNHAVRFSDHVVAMRGGAIVSQGPPHEIMTHDMLRDVFNIEADIVHDSRTGLPMCIPFQVCGAPPPEAARTAGDAVAAG